MNQVRAYISGTLSVLIFVASLLPALHAFDHERSAKHDHVSSEIVSTISIHCELCDFQISSAEAPIVYNYELYIPLKETVYSISLAQSANLFPDPLFSLRAPPVVIS